MNTTTIILGRILPWACGLHSQISLASDALPTGAPLSSSFANAASGPTVSGETQIGIYVLIASVYALYWWKNRI